MTSDAPQPTSQDVSLTDFQAKIRDMYYEKDVQRGVDGTFMWLMEEVGELASALRQGSRGAGCRVRRCAGLVGDDCQRGGDRPRTSHFR